jgi:hypothetical protein
MSKHSFRLARTTHSFASNVITYMLCICAVSQVRHGLSCYCCSRSPIIFFSVALYVSHTGGSLFTRRHHSKWKPSPRAYIHTPVTQDLAGLVEMVVPSKQVYTRYCWVILALCSHMYLEAKDSHASTALSGLCMLADYRTGLVLTLTPTLSLQGSPTKQSRTTSMSLSLVVW